MSGICYIVGAAGSKGVDFIRKADDCVIAADGGYDNLKRCGMLPDILVGDFDSINDSDVDVNGMEIIKYPTKKDDTDVFIAVKLAMEKDYKDIVFYGVLGGRFDHSLGNIQLLTYLSKRGIRSKIIGDDVEILALTDDKITLDRKEGLLSIFCHDERAIGVTIKGAMYEVENIELSNDVPLGISNEFIGKEVFVEVKDGTLIIMYQR